VLLGLIEAFVGALCYGVATVLQAIGARGVERAQTGVNPRLLLRVLRSLPFLAGLGLDGLGLVFNVAALRELPLFTVQAIVNTNLAVTAVVCQPLLHIRLRRRDWLCVGTVCVGLVLVALAAGHEAPVHRGTGFQVGLLVAAVSLLGAALLVGNSKLGTADVLGACAGLLFGVFALCVRVLPSLQPLTLLRSPALYALLIASIGAFLFFTTALQRGSVTSATAAMVVGETAVPALLGVLLLGDHARHGFGPVAVLGFVLAVGGALPLSRFGEASGVREQHADHAHDDAPPPADPVEPDRVRSPDGTRNST
jgi:drug/metabolite transporter (DMT)-like permease